MNLGNRTALAAALLAPMVSSIAGLFEMVLFPQSVAGHLLLWSLATEWPAVREGRRVLLPAVLVALTAWTT